MSFLKNWTSNYLLWSFLIIWSQGTIVCTRTAIIVICDAFLMIVGSTHCKVNQQFDGVPTDCVFPFTYNGVTYRACTSANKTRCQFHQCFMSCFYAHRSQKHKKGWQLDCIFLLFACIKASHNFHQCYIRSFWPSRFTLILLLHGIEHIA